MKKIILPFIIGFLIGAGVIYFICSSKSSLYSGTIAGSGFVGRYTVPIDPSTARTLVNNYQTADAYPDNVVPASFLIRSVELVKFFDKVKTPITPEYIQVFFARNIKSKTEPLTLVIAGMHKGKSIYFLEPDINGKFSYKALEHVFPCHAGMCTGIPAPVIPDNAPVVP